MAVGDILLQTKDGEYRPLFYVEDALKNADIVFGNLEVPVTNVEYPSLQKAVLLKTCPENLSFLTKANSSIVVNLANNHICDYGSAGAIETIDHLKNSNVQYIGVGRNMSECLKEVIFKINDRTIAFIGFYIGVEGSLSDCVYIAGMDQQLVRHRIAELKAKYDFVVVSFHWGIENVFHPSPEQQVFARECIDEGASVIIGHHPHRFQGVEKYHGGLIFYSLGNFNFWPCGVGLSPYKNLSAIADITLHKEGRVEHSLVPVKIGDDYAPRIITDAQELALFQSHMENISLSLNSGIEKWWWFGEIARPYLVDNGKSFLIRIRLYGVKHLYQMVRWLCSRFVIKCYAGIIFRWLRRGHSDP